MPDNAMTVDAGVEQGRLPESSAADIARYYRIVIALHEAIRIMGEIDEVIDGHGG